MSELIHRWFFRQVDASSLAVFRILLGGLLLFESVNYGIFLCLDCMYRDTAMLFKYHHFEWVKLWPGLGLELTFLVMGISAVCIMLGLFYRIAMVVYTVAFTYHFLLDQALYLNHFYLVILFCVIMIFVPANRLWSIDAMRQPAIASATVPNWGRFWLGAQLEIVLVYAGLVKLNPDWLNLEPMRLWMNARSYDEAAIFQWFTQDWGIALSSYGVIALHLIGAPLLLWRRTRLFVFFIYLFFHCINAFVFDIGIFPWLTLAATLMLFDPDWPRQVLRWLQARGHAQRWQHAALTANPPVQQPGSIRSVSSTSRALIVTAIVAWLLVQLVVPSRHHVAPGNVAWNEDGHRFSWRMKLRSKSGQATFVVQRDDGQSWTIEPATYLNARQTRKMVCIPDLIWQFAQFLETEFNNGGQHEVKVYADAMCSLNTRDSAALVNRLVDLTSIPRDEPVTNWILPLSKSLPKYIF